MFFGLTLTVLAAALSSNPASAQTTENNRFSQGAGIISLSSTVYLPGNVGTDYSSRTLVASGGEPPYHFALRSGILPPGLAIDSTTGIISGIPETAGTFDFSLSAIDANDLEGSESYRIIIDPSVSAIAFLTTTLPKGNADTLYPAQTIRIQGGVTPYTFTLASGSLPQGLTLNATTGVISGTPTTAGIASFVLTATDSQRPNPNYKSRFLVAIVIEREPGTPTPEPEETHAIVLHNGEETRISAVFVPDAQSEGLPGAVFIFAYLPPTVTPAPNSLWVMGADRKWHLYGGCDTAPAFFSGLLQTLDNIDILATTRNLSVLNGAELYAGYGLSNPAPASGQACNNMLARQQWTKIFTVS